MNGSPSATRPDAAADGIGAIESALPGESTYVEANGIRLHTRGAGPEDGPLVVLLHGFPEFWYGWHAQIEPLAAAGYRVVVPDQRGYNRSEKPVGVGRYRLDELAADVVGLIDAFDRERAAIAGHDWGAAVAWWLGLQHPDRLTSLTAVNVPHPTVMARRLRTSWRQRRKSWYVAFFQLPVVPELAARVGDYRLFARTMVSSSRPGTFDATDRRRYRAAWSRPGALTGMLNWYRAMARYRPEPARETVSTPTLVCWGMGDEFLEGEMAAESVAHCEDGRLERFDEATHWVLHEEPAGISETLLEHIEAHR